MDWEYRVASSIRHKLQDDDGTVPSLAQVKMWIERIKKARSAYAFGDVEHMQEILRDHFSQGKGALRLSLLCNEIDKHWRPRRGKGKGRRVR